jgi:hypothetical protein
MFILGGYMIQEIAAALASLKATTDIAKGIIALNVDVEVKTKTSTLISSIIDLQSSMLDLQNKIGNIQRENEELKTEVSRLRALASERGSLQFDGKMYRKDNDPTPFCPHCLENNQKQIHLSGPNYSSPSGTFYQCNVCGNYITI